MIRTYFYQTKIEWSKHKR